MPDPTKKTISATEASALFGSSRVRISDGGCWIWLGAKNTHGYGHLKWHGKYYQAHRLAFEGFKGPIPNRLVIDHLCRCRECVNPEHLEAVTNRENLLRGNGKTSAMSHCKRGHLLAGDNVRMSVMKGYPARNCRECKRIRDRSTAHA